MTLHQFNANDYVRVRLTDVGRTELKRQHDEFYQSLAARGITLSPSEPYKEVDGWSRWQLWSLMYQLGPLMQLGTPEPFEMNMVFESVR